MPVISVGEYQPPVPHLCGGCGGKIADRYYLLAVDRQWHVRCLTCCECKVQLDSELTCFARDGNIYCKEDYYRLFAVKRCARCQRGIFANELVMRARDLVYHLHCFTCAWCNTALTQGDYFGLRDNLVYCRVHYELMTHGENFLPNGESGPLLPSSEDLMESGEGGCNLHLSSLDSNSATSTGLNPSSASQRTKRMRTSFKHHQLRTMKSYFAINQNPDAKDLKQLAQKTGLSKRVLQVWFQNARAKWRRNNLRQVDLQQGGQNSQNPQPSSQSTHPNSPGATSSFSEPSPCGGGSGMGAELSHASSLPPPAAQPGVMEYEGNSGLTSLVPRHVSPSGEPLPLTSFQELF
nr:LIM/homeobox protein Lhx9-like [Parasteatoda tepidariorum]